MILIPVLDMEMECLTATGHGVQVRIEVNFDAGIQGRHVIRANGAAARNVKL